MKDKLVIPMAQEVVIPRSFLDAWKHRKANFTIEGFWSALESAFNEVNGKATRFTIGSLDVIDSVTRCEDRLNELKISRASRVGISLVRQSAGPSGAYKYRTIGTCYQATVVHNNSWRLDFVKRVLISPGGAGLRVILMHKGTYMRAAESVLPDVRVLQDVSVIGETK